MTKKSFVLEVTDLVKQNPKQIFAGHGLPSAMLQMISGRPDVIGKLATFAYSTVNAKKGAKSLMKTGNFKVSAYPNFNVFNGKARQDVEKFMMGLSPADADTFVNSNNIITLIVLPDTETGDTANDIANLKSVAITFDKAVSKEYKTPGASYITIMYGDSVIRPTEAVIAEKKEKVNKKIVDRKTPAKIKAELTAKAKAKLAKLKLSSKALSTKAGRLGAEMNQFAEVSKIFGVEGASAKELATAMKNYTKETKAFLNSLSPADKKLYKTAAKAKADKQIRLMSAALRELSPEVMDRVEAIVRGGNLTSADAVLEARKKVVKLEISELTKKNTELIAKAEAAPTSKLRANIMFAVRKNIEKINMMKAKIASHKDMSVRAIKNKANLLAETNAALEANRMAGMTISQALNAAIAQLPVSQQVKQQVKQQVVQQIADGTNPELALQQTLQTTMQQVTPGVVDFDDEFDGIEDVFGNMDEESAMIASDLANTKSVAQILASL